MIDGATNNTTTVAVGAGPIAVAVNPVTNQIYVVNANSNNVTVIDGATNNTTTVAVGSILRRGGEPGHKPDLCRQSLDSNQHRDGD